MTEAQEKLFRAMFERIATATEQTASDTQAIKSLLQQLRDQRETQQRVENVLGKPKR